MLALCSFLQESNETSGIVLAFVLGQIFPCEILVGRIILFRYLKHLLGKGLGCIRTIGLSKTGVFALDMIEIGDVGHQGWTAEVDDHFEHATLIDLRVGQKDVLTGAEQMIEFAVGDVAKNGLYEGRLLCFVDEMLLVQSCNDDIAGEILLLQNIDGLLKDGDTLGLSQLPEEEEINLIGLHGILYFRSHFKRIDLFGEFVAEVRVIDGASLIAKIVERLKGVFAVADDGRNVLLIEGNLLRLSCIFAISPSNLEDVMDDDEEVRSANDANKELVNHAQTKGLIDVGAAVRKTKECKDEKSPGELHHHEELAAMVEVEEERLLTAIGCGIVGEHANGYALGLERIAERLVVEMHASLGAYGIDQINHKRNIERA